MVKQKKPTCITQSGKNYAINCAIQGVHLIWKQKIWLAICEFLWSLNNQNAWFVTSFYTELTLFCTVKKKTALPLTNQNGKMFSRILLGTETCACIDIKWANISMLLLTKVSGNCDNVSFNWSTVLTFSERYSALDINNREAGICSSRCNSNHCKITAMHWKLTQQKIWEQLSTARQWLPDFFIPSKHG